MSPRHTYDPGCGPLVFLDLGRCVEEFRHSTDYCVMGFLNLNSGWEDSWGKYKVWRCELGLELKLKDKVGTNTHNHGHVVNRIHINLNNRGTKSVL